MIFTMTVVAPDYFIIIMGLQIVILNPCVHPLRIVAFRIWILRVEALLTVASSFEVSKVLMIVLGLLITLCSKVPSWFVHKLLEGWIELTQECHTFFILLFLIGLRRFHCGSNESLMISHVDICDLKRLLSYHVRIMVVLLLRTRTLITICSISFVGKLISKVVWDRTVMCNQVFRMICHGCWIS